MHLADVGEPWSDIADVMLREAGGRIEHALKQWQKDQAAGKSGKAEEILGGLVLLSEVEASARDFVPRRYGRRR